MATYLVLATLTDYGRENVRGYAERWPRNIEQLRETGIRIVADYALMGDYDLVYIVEALDATLPEHVVQDCSVGTIVFHTCPAVPMDDFVRIIERSAEYACDPSLRLVRLHELTGRGHPGFSPTL